ncbi:MAG: tetratricopeptide repeat protein [Anaerolineales bacterium]|jgi:tetratricopeptide (TPR) repeat protein
MYLRGSKWSTKKKPRRSSPWRVLLLLILIGVVIYIDRAIVPQVPPLFSPTPTPTRSPVSYVMEAQDLFDRGKLVQAKQAFEQAIAINPEEAIYYMELARLQVFVGEYEEAEINARNALLLEPESARAKAILGWVLDFRASEAADPLESENLLRDALEWLEKALEIDANSALAHAYYAEVLIDNDLADYEQALQEAMTALQLAPDLLEAHRAMGYVWELTGNYERAVEAYETALRLNPNLAILYVSLGNMYLALGDVDTAIDHYLSASARAPNDVLAYQKLAIANARIGEFGQASQYAEDAMLLEPWNPHLHGELGRMYYKYNDLVRAIEQLGMAIHGGRMPDVWVIAGQRLLIMPETELGEAIEVGDEVRVAFESDTYGAMIALRIDLVSLAASGSVGLAGAQEFTGILESIEEGATVLGLPLDPSNDRVVEFYYTYALALAKNAQCDLAREIAQVLLVGARDNEFAVVNAGETLAICNELQLIVEPEETATPSP